MLFQKTPYKSNEVINTELHACDYLLQTVTSDLVTTNLNIKREKYEH